MCILCERKMVVLALDNTKPYVVLNFKTYKESNDDNAIKLAKIAQKVQKITGVNMIVCPQLVDIKDVASKVRIPVYAQHIDPLPIGKSTGGIIAENLIDNNIHGSILNHSEHRLDMKILEESVLKLKELDMKSIVCVKDDKEALKISKFAIKPDFIAVEPPELIGGETSVSSAKPDIIKKAVDACHGINVLVGAGIKSNEDFKIAIEYGAKGVLLASHFVLSKDPEKFLIELIKGQ